jgi:hypothetical protein
MTITETSPIPAEVPTPVKAPAKKVSVAKRVASDVAGVESAAEKVAAAVEFDLHKGITDAVTEAEKTNAAAEHSVNVFVTGLKADLVAAEKAAPGLLSKLKASLAPNLAHLSGQALAFYTVATHDLTKWEAAVATIGTGFVTSIVKKVSAKIG